MGSTTRLSEGEASPNVGPAGVLLRRERLLEGLTAARGCRVVVLEAPAGYSKSTTIRLWEAADPRPFAWVDCERRHDDPALLVEDLVGALARVGIDPEAYAALSQPTPDLTLILERIGAAIATLGPFVLVFDDAHLLATDKSWQVVYSVIAAMPAKSQVAVASRSHPGLPLGRLRARGELFELGMGDLALTRRESHELLAGLDLDLGERADQIHERAEGWPAAMYLAGLAIRQDGGALPEDATFDGGDRVIVEYFRDEFVRDLPDEEARFLYRTSILDELNGPLCDAVTGGTDSLAMLRRLAAGNALVVPLDRADTSFRYHHLFRDMLRSELRIREPQAEKELHHRAAIWQAANGDIPRATDHAIQSGDFELAGAYIWLDVPDITGRGRIATVDRWFEEIGDDRIARIPALILARAHRETAMGCGDEAYYWLAVAEREIGVDSPAYGDLFALRATLGPDGPAGMVADGDRAAALLATTSPWQVPAKLYKGIGLYLEEDAAAIPLLRETAREAASVSPIIQVMAQVQLALDALDRDQVDEAHGIIIRARDVIERNGLRILRVMSLIYAVLALAKARRGEVDSAVRELESSHRIGEGMVDFVGWHEAELTIARCRTLLRIGQFNLADEHLKQAEAVATRMPGSPRLEGWISWCRDEIEKRRGSATAAGVNLTKAEIRTLQFLPSHHSFRAIGDQLYLSQNTVKTQANSLYRKLGVNSRAEAVMEGRRLGLLEGDGQ
jgi:LuxR family maltose regulon positive regulatory protein